MTFSTKQGRKMAASASLKRYLSLLNAANSSGRKSRTCWSNNKPLRKNQYHNMLVHSRELLWGIVDTPSAGMLYWIHRSVKQTTLEGYLILQLSPLELKKVPGQRLIKNKKPPIRIFKAILILCNRGPFVASQSHQHVSWSQSLIAAYLDHL